MSPKRGERVAPPPGPGEYDLFFATSEAAKGWVDLIPLPERRPLGTTS